MTESIRHFLETNPLAMQVRPERLPLIALVLTLLLYLLLSLDPFAKKLRSKIELIWGYLPRRTFEKLNHREEPRECRGISHFMLRATGVLLLALTAFQFIVAILKKALLP